LFSSKTKHIKVRYHFIRDYVQKNVSELKFVKTNKWVDIFTKALHIKRFNFTKANLNLVEFTND